jgi:hypothetical protein
MENISQLITMIISLSDKILDYEISLIQLERVKNRFNLHGIISAVEESFKLQKSILITRQEELLIKCKTLLIPLLQGRVFIGFKELFDYRLSNADIDNGYKSLIEKDTNQIYILFLHEYVDSRNHIYPGQLVEYVKIVQFKKNYEDMVKQINMSKPPRPNVIKYLLNHYGYANRQT